MTADVTIHLDKTITKMRGGFGASWHAIEQPEPVTEQRSHGGSVWGGHPPASDSKAWEQLYKHASWLGLNFLRVEVEQRMFNPEKDVFTFDNEEMKILYRILDWCEESGADVFFQHQHCNVEWNAWPEFKGDEKTIIHSSPYDVEAFAEALAKLVEHLVVTKGYTCIKWLCITNEPAFDWGWWLQPPNDPAPLTPALKAVREALDRLHIDLPISAPDWSEKLPPEKAEVDYDEYIGAYDAHSYRAIFDWMENPAPGEYYPLCEEERRMKQWVALASGAGKPFFLTELGTMAFGWGKSNPAPNSLHACLKDAELVLRLLNLGVEGFNHWSFVNRGDLDGQWQMVKTWDIEKGKLLKDFEPMTYSYYIYGLICRFSPKHASILKTEVEDGKLKGKQRVFSATIQAEDGQFSTFIVNDSDEPAEIRIFYKGTSGSAKVQKYTVQRVEESASPDLEKTQLFFDPTKSYFPKLTIPPLSFTVLTTWNLEDDEPGIM